MFGERQHVGSFAPPAKQAIAFSALELDRQCRCQAKGALARDERAVSRLGTYVLHVSRPPRALPVRVGWTLSFRIRSQTRLVEAIIYR
jgi:hypothetical protein